MSSISAEGWNGWHWSCLIAQTFPSSWPVLSGPQSGMPKVWITYFSSYVISVKNHRIIEYRVMRYLSNHLGNFLCSIHKCHLQYLLPFIFHSLLELLKWTLWSTINCASLWNKWRLHGRINILSLLHEPESVTLCTSFQPPASTPKLFLWMNHLPEQTALWPCYLLCVRVDSAAPLTTLTSAVPVPPQGGSHLGGHVPGLTWILGWDSKM